MMKTAANTWPSRPFAISSCRSGLAPICGDDFEHRVRSRASGAANGHDRDARRNDRPYRHHRCSAASSQSVLLGGDVIAAATPVTTPVAVPGVVRGVHFHSDNGGSRGGEFRLSRAIALRAQGGDTPTGDGDLRSLPPSTGIPVDGSATPGRPAALPAAGFRRGRRDRRIARRDASPHRARATGVGLRDTTRGLASIENGISGTAVFVATIAAAGLLAGAYSSQFRHSARGPRLCMRVIEPEARARGTTDIGRSSLFTHRTADAMPWQTPARDLPFLLSVIDSKGGPTMAKKQGGGRADRPKEVSLDQLLDNARTPGAPGRAADPSTRDGDSSRGNINETEDVIERTDNDVGDDVEADLPLAGPSGGAVGGTPVRGRARGGRTGRGLTGSGGRGDSTIGSKPRDTGVPMGLLGPMGLIRT